MKSPSLRIVSINDVYSLEHLPRLRSLVLHHAAHDPADLLLVTLAGDFLAPSVLSSLDAGAGMVDCLNHVPITHAILGNHEDDLEVGDLRARLRELRCTVLLTNVRGLDDSLPTHQVLAVGPHRVGLLGVVDADPTLYRRPPFGGARMEPANDAATRWARALRSAGCDVVIAITHQRVAEDRALARGNAPITLVLGGHEHDGLVEHVAPAWLVKAPADAVQAAVVDLQWDPDGGPPRVRVRMEPLASYPPDPALLARVQTHMAPLREIERATLLLLPPGEVLSSVGTRARQTSMGALVCSRLRDSLDAEGCLFNGGGIRGAREYRGQLTFGDVKLEVPFENEVVVARLPGRTVRDAIATSRAKAPAESGGFLQVDDRIVVDGDGAVTEIDGAPFDPERTYRIALVRNLFDGMDGVEPLVRFARERPDEVPSATTGRDVRVVLLRAFAGQLWDQLGGVDAMDTDGNGEVDVRELMDAIARATNDAPSELAARAVLDALDGDRDGAISRGEGRGR